MDREDRYSANIHVLCDGNGTLLGIAATGDRRHEPTEPENLIQNCELSIYRYKPLFEAIVVDNGYSGGATRKYLLDRPIEPVIGPKSVEARGKNSVYEAYRRRNVVERLMGWLKETRRVATRYD